MKKKLLLWFSTGLFWIGHVFGRLTIILRSRIMTNWYLWIMDASSKIQDKYNLEGPWKPFNEEQQ